MSCFHKCLQEVGAFAKLNNHTYNNTIVLLVHTENLYSVACTILSPYANEPPAVLCLGAQHHFVPSLRIAPCWRVGER